MQKWEYREESIVEVRAVHSSHPLSRYFTNAIHTKKPKLIHGDGVHADLGSYLARLGEQGWELVSIDRSPSPFDDKRTKKLLSGFLFTWAIAKGVELGQQNALFFIWEAVFKRPCGVKPNLLPQS